MSLHKNVVDGIVLRSECSGSQTRRIRQASNEKESENDSFFIRLVANENVEGVRFGLNSENLNALTVSERKTKGRSSRRYFLKTPNDRPKRYR